MKLTSKNLRLIGGGETHTWLDTVVRHAADSEGNLPVGIVGALNAVGYTRNPNGPTNVFVCKKPDLSWKQAGRIFAETLCASNGYMPLTGHALELIRWAAPEYAMQLKKAAA